MVIFIKQLIWLLVEISWFFDLKHLFSYRKVSNWNYQQGAINDIKQNFTYTLNRTIKHVGKNNLCITVAKGKSSKGGGGTPPHLMRYLIIDDCQEVKNEYNTWEMIN